MAEDFTPMPVTVIGGYLGAGKTTLVNHLLRNADGRKLAIMVNEFGQLPIDEDLIEAEDDNLISLAGGCVCCSYGNDMVSALIELSKMNPRPDHVVLEASGVAIPGAIASAVSLLNDFAMDGIIVLLDAANILSLASDVYMADTIRRQVSDSDIIILNKVDLVNEAMHGEIAGWLSALGSNAQTVLATRSAVPTDIVLQSFQRGRLDFDNHEGSHLAGFSSQVIVPPEPVDAFEFGKKLIEMNPDIVRAKGFVETLSGQLKTIQIVGKRLEFSDAPEHVDVGIVLIQKDTSNLSE